ncbi:MAG: cytochrome b/b6 domain-containing protein [Cyanobacteria bacterium P01_A01_bin.135]
MKKTQPYQPLLLRLLHGLNGGFLIAAIVTAFWTYNVYDGRWGRLSLPDYQAIEGVHGTFGLYTLLIFPAFVVYSFHRGQKRLLQPEALDKKALIGTPIWWHNLSRFTNTLSLITLTSALFSGKMMDETWLPQGELNHGWYYAHLISWVVMVGVIALHLLLKAKVGGAPLLLSMLNWRFIEKDHPARWPTHIQAWQTHIRSKPWIHWIGSLTTLAPLESLILVSLAAAWVISFLKQAID